MSVVVQGGLSGCRRWELSGCSGGGVLMKWIMSDVSFYGKTFLINKINSKKTT